MHIVLKCPSCSANLKAPSKLAGKKLKCPKCATMLIVPSPQVAQVAQAAEPQLEEIDPLQTPIPNAAPIAPQATPVSQMPQQARPVANSYAKKPKSGKTNWLLLGAIGAAMLAIFGGTIVALSFYFSGSSASSPGDIVLSDGRKLSEVTPRKFQRQDVAPPKQNQFDTGIKQLRNPSYPGSDDDLAIADLIELVEPSIVRIKVVDYYGNEGIGSGFFVDKEGKIFTNFHVVRNASKVTVKTADNRELESLGFLIQDREKDLAIIQVDPSDLEISPIAIASELPRKGEEVAAFGNPQGFGFSQTTGIVSSVRPGKEVSDTLKELNQNFDIYGDHGFALQMDWIQHSAAISGGNSGGPLVNMRGQLVGVNTWTHPEGQNLNFASTMKEVESVFSARDDMLKQYRVSRVSPSDGPVYEGSQ